MTAFRTVRMNRRAVAASLGAGALVAPQFLKSTPVFATQESDRALNTIANETEPAALDPWLRGYGQMLVTRQIFEPLVDVRMTLVEGSESEVDLRARATKRGPKIGIIGVNQPSDDRGPI